MSVDPAEQLQRLYLAGFELETFDGFPKCVGVARDGRIALLVPGVDGLQILGASGWRWAKPSGCWSKGKAARCSNGSRTSSMPLLASRRLSLVSRLTCRACYHNGRSTRVAHLTAAALHNTNYRTLR